MAIQLSSYPGQSCDWADLPCHLSSFGEYMLNVLVFIPAKAFELLTDGLAAAAAAIDIPVDTSALQGIPSGVSWFTDICAVPEGFAIVLTATLARFALKLIPTLGF